MTSIRYTSKVVRDGGLAATLTMLVVKGEIEDPIIKGLAIACAAGAAICAIKRMPLVMSELNGFLPQGMASRIGRLTA